MTFVSPELNKELQSKRQKLLRQSQSQSQKKTKGNIITVTPHGGTIHPSLLTSTNSTVPMSIQSQWHP